MTEYFFDSYALIEVLLNAPNFSSYMNSKITMTSLNQIEVSYYFLIHFGEEKAKEVCNAISEYIVELSDNEIIDALKFRKENKSKSLSYADCIGYIYAKNNGLVFLTGDDAFKNMPNVEFVK